mmetsp:Transcript_27735/g.41970  ORF Transcript_27735/g.41970 Transcript_27735/m.41970 type:complete len:533 (+) Transcript_27735:70-1668(+)
MITTTRHKICWAWVFATLLPLLVSSSSSSSNVRIYLLTGQSNMVGEGCEAHLDHLVTNDPTTYGHLKNSNGNWTQHPNVNVTLFQDDMFYNPDTALQPLTSVGQGRTTTLFGPEVGIGWTLAEQYPDTKILLLKVAWGGIDLAINLRPPSSSILYNGDLSTSIYDKYGSSSTVAGQYYNWLVSRTEYVLSTLPPELYGSSPRRRLDGIFFLQGWNDLADKTGDKMREYEYNLVNFITDLRRDLNATDVPFVVGEAGHHGNSHDNRGHEYRVDGVREAQRNIGRRYPQFFCNAQMAETTKFVMELQEKGERCPVPAICGCPEYHYYNNAELFYKIGVEMGTVMTSFDDCILPGPSASPSETPTGAPTIIPPTESPMPSPAPSDEPTIVEPTPPTPTASPTKIPSNAPSNSPSSQSPSALPSATPNPSHDTESPTESPEPSPAPTDTTDPPTESPEPSPAPTRLTEIPTLFPTLTIEPSTSPSESPISRQLQRAIVTLEDYLEPEFDPSDEENRALWEAVRQMIQVAQLQQSNE